MPAVRRTIHDHVANEPYQNAWHQRNVMSTNIKRSNKNTWLRESKGKLRHSVLICTATSIDSVKDIDDAFFVIGDEFKTEKKPNNKQENWINLIKTQVNEKKLTWRLLEQIQLVDYANRYTLHCKTTPHYGDLINTGLIGLRTGTKLFALPPLLEHVTLNTCHSFNVYSNDVTYAQPILLDEIEYTNLLDDCLAAKRWHIIIELLDLFFKTKDESKIKDIEEYFEKEYQLIIERLELTKTKEEEKEQEIYKKLKTERSNKDVKNWIETEQPNCKNSSLLSWTGIISLESKAYIYSYLTKLKPIGLILSHPHPYNLSHTSNKIDVGKTFKIKFYD